MVEPFILVLSSPKTFRSKLFLNSSYWELAPTVVLSMDGFESTFCESIHFLMSLKMLGSSTGKGSMTDKV